LITLDETAAPSARAVAAFGPDVDFSRIVIGTHPDSRKTHHVRNTPTVVLSYIDAGNRGYLTVIGRAALDDSLKQRQEYWE
jgi:general stress protein 26